MSRAYRQREPDAVPDSRSIWLVRDAFGLAEVKD